MSMQVYQDTWTSTINNEVEGKSIETDPCIPN